MGAGDGGTGQSLTYQESANFIFNGNAFLVDLLNNNSLGNGFDTAVFQILSNGTVVDSQSFNTLASAQAFFSDNPIDVALASGLHDVQLTFDETMSSTGGFSFNYATVSGGHGGSAAPLPPSWTMMLIGLVGLGFVAYRRQKKTSAIAA